MSKKKFPWLLATVLGATATAVAVHEWQQEREERKKEQALAQVRAFFTEMGPIATIYIFEQASTADWLQGGVVMEDGVVYTFENNQGSIRYDEEKQ